MASPQLEDGYTRIANELLEAIIAAKLSGQELRLLLFIVRKTYGFNKKADFIALSQMGGIATMSKCRCSQVIRSLECRKMITVTENIYGIGKKYMLNKDFHQWKGYRKTDTVSEKRNRPCRKSDTTKDNTTKDKEVLVLGDDQRLTQVIPTELAGLPLYEADKKLCSKLPELLPTWKIAYPGIDILAEIRKAHAWEMGNPENRKVNRSRFLTNWLNRAQDNTGGRNAANQRNTGVQPTGTRQYSYRDDHKPDKFAGRSTVIETGKVHGASGSTSAVSGGDAKGHPNATPKNE